MNREIKFRVWTGSTMEYNVISGKFGTFYVNPGKNGDGLNEHDSACLTTFNTIYSPMSPVMQYTGLKDVNGYIEVYDYDIIDSTGEVIGNYYENSPLLNNPTNLLIEGFGTHSWRDAEAEALKRGCKYAG